MLALADGVLWSLIQSHQARLVPGRLGHNHGHERPWPSQPLPPAPV